MNTIVNHLDPKQNYGAEPWRAPDVPEDEKVLLDEPGRITWDIDYRSHYLRATKDAIYVRHGAGQEIIQNYGMGRVVDAIKDLPSDARYIVLYRIYDCASKAGRESAERTATEYRQAFADGRLKKRKLPKQGKVRVWIESVCNR